MRILVIAILFVSAILSTSAQKTILDNAKIAGQIEKCLYNTYAIDIDEAKKLQQRIQNELPRHPVGSFLEALIIYWENFPLLPGQDQADQFLAAMKKSSDLSLKILKKDPENMEAIFFDLHARAFLAMFWADNGRPAKVLFDIDNLYRRTMQGIKYKSEFNEFYFSSGLYSYYVEAYVEAHPAYKPVARLFRRGNKEEGLKEIQYAIDSSTYIKTEAMLFMSLLQLNYEKDMKAALDIAATLYNRFPNNTYYTGHLLMILLHTDEFAFAKAILQELQAKNDNFSKVLYDIYSGFIYENQQNRPALAEKNYLNGIEKSIEFGDFCNIYKAIAYAGLSRIEASRSNYQEARRFRKRSRHYSSYEFILSYE